MAKKGRKLRRDELGRFASVKKPVARRDAMGRFAPSKRAAGKPSKKVSPVARLRVSPAKAKPKKAAPAKAAPAKVKPKKAAPAKAAPAKAKPKKAAPAKAAPAKAKPKKVSPAKVAPTKAKPKKKPPVRKAPPTKAKPRKPPVKKAPPRKKRRRRGELPLLAERSRQAEVLMQDRLVQLQDGIALVQPGLDMGIQTFVNLDGTVDGELRISNLPSEWREIDGVGSLVATLSSALRTFQPFPPRPSMGGAFWAAFGIRFGPQNETEIGELADLYKRFRGLFQIGTYPTPAWNTGPLQLALVGDTVGLRAMIASLMEKRGLPATVILIRFIWTPDGKRPAHYEGEK